MAGSSERLKCHEKHTFCMATTRESVLGQARRSLPWFVLAATLLTVTLWVVGVGGILDALGETSPRGFALVVVLVAGLLTARGLAIGRALAILGHPVSVPRAVAFQLSVTFSNNVTPSGQVGGTPLAGLFVSRGSDADYEVSCGAVLSVGILDALLAVVFSAIGIGVLLVTTTVGETLRIAALSTIGLFAFLVVVCVGLWSVRDRARAVTAGVLTTLARAAGRLPGVPAPDRETINERLSGFGGAVMRVARGPRRDVAAVLAALVVTYVCSVGALWTAFDAVGLTVSPLVLFAVLPVAFATTSAPLPGGLGGFEAALTTLIVTVTGLQAASVGAGVLVYRVVLFWLGTFVGAIAATLVSTLGTP